MCPSEWYPSLSLISLQLSVSHRHLSVWLIVPLVSVPVCPTLMSVWLSVPLPCLSVCPVPSVRLSVPLPCLSVLFHLFRCLSHCLVCLSCSICWGVSRSHVFPAMCTACICPTLRIGGLAALQSCLAICPISCVSRNVHEVNQKS